MKEIMIPYILLIWLLVKMKIMPWNLKTQVWSTGVGLLRDQGVHVAGRLGQGDVACGHYILGRRGHPGQLPSGLRLSALHR